ncbi:MAG: YigZ family protein [Lachnospiraceae bacterium]|nr:YigZ family protein [Lachnospiraceae bacterium]
MDYKIIYEPGEGEIVEKKSRFIGIIRSVENEEQALAFIAAKKKQYWNATHNCWAYVIGKNQEIVRCSDDGEPSGTAGKPMLDVLLKEEIHNAVVVVTRYFGGTLLGTGGLVRAYQQGVKAALDNAVVVKKLPGVKGKVTTDYNGIGKIQYIMRTMEVLEMASEYTDIVTVDFMIPVEKYQSFVDKVTEGTNGKAEITKLAEMYYGDALGECVLFEE